MRIKKLLLINILCFICLNNTSYAYFNPDGEVWRPGIDISVNFPKVGFETKTQPALSLIMPVSKQITYIIGYSYMSLGYYSLQSALTGINIHSTSINGLNELVNPDGKVGNFVFTPFAGINWTERQSDFTTGLSINSVISNFTTLYLSYTLNRQSNRSHQTIILGTNLHLQRNFDNSVLINPDGRPGLITLSPHVGAIVYEHTNTHILAGIYVRSPLNQIITLSLLFDHISEVDDFSPETANQFGLGFTLYF